MKSLTVTYQELLNITLPLCMNNKAIADSMIGLISQYYTKSRCRVGNTRTIVYDFTNLKQIAKYL